MSDPAILFVKPKAVNAKDKKALQAAGVVVVEVENPAEVKFTRAHAELSSSELLNAAVKAIVAVTVTNEAKVAFSDAVCAALLAKGEPKADVG